VAKNETGKSATFQAFGGKGIGQLITADNIASNTITTNEIAANTITANNIAAGTITSNNIAANTITSNNIAAGSINADRINTSQLTVGTNVNLGTAQSASQVTTIIGNTVTTGYVNALGITAGSISASNVTAGTLTAISFVSASGTGARLIIDGSNMAYYDGSGYPFFVAFVNSSGLGNAGDFRVGSSTKYFSWDNDPGVMAISGSVVVSNASGYRVAIEPDNRRFGIFTDDTLRASVYTDADGDFKLEATDDMVLKVPSGKQFRFQINSTNTHIIDTDGDMMPGNNNSRRVGTNAVSYGEMHSYKFTDHCLWLDELDDLALLKATQPKKDKSGNIERDKDGNAKLDHYSLPEWLHTGNALREEVSAKKISIKKELEILDKSGKKKKEIENQRKILEEELSNYDISEEEIIDRTGRNLGHFVDLVAGAVRQLDNKIETLITKNKLK
jgi:hypothetical protein